MNLEQAVAEYEEMVKEKEKAEHEEYVKSLIDYAEFCQAIADVLTKSAQEALLEAAKESTE